MNAAYTNQSSSVGAPIAVRKGPSVYGDQGPMRQSGMRQSGMEVAQWRPCECMVSKECCCAYWFPCLQLKWNWEEADLDAGESGWKQHFGAWLLEEFVVPVGFVMVFLRPKWLEYTKNLAEVAEQEDPSLQKIEELTNNLYSYLQQLSVLQVLVLLAFQLLLAYFLNKKRMDLAAKTGHDPKSADEFCCHFFCLPCVLGTDAKAVKEYQRRQV